MTLLHPQLEAFLAVAQCKSMHGAAKLVHLTQTAITQRIHALERRLRTTLFIRSRQGVSLTDAGLALLRYCQNTLNLEGETLAQIKQSGIATTVRLRINGPSSVMTTRIIPACLSLLKNFPQLLMTFEVNDSQHRIQSLQAGMSDIVVIEPEYVFKEMQIKKIKSENYILVCTSEWKNRALHEILQNERIIDFEESDQMTMNYLKHFQLLVRTQYDRHFINRTESLITMLTEGYGYGVLTKKVCEPYLASKQLIMLNEAKEYQHRLVLAWYKRTEPPVYFSQAIENIN